MKYFRQALPAIVLAIAVLGMATAPAFAALCQQTCAAKQHDCSRCATVTACSCTSTQYSATPSSLTQPRAEVRVQLSALPLPVSAVVGARLSDVTSVIDASPPHRSTLDLPTFLSALLI